MADQVASESNVPTETTEGLGDWIKSFFKHENDLTKEAALKLCKNHLRGEWLNVTPEDIDLSVIVAGFVNRIFMCKNNKASGEARASDKSCIIRLYGGKFITHDTALRMNGYEGEVLTFHLLGQASIGPKLYGVFDGGRVEEYLTSYTTLTDQDVGDEVAMRALARKWAQMHASSIPVSKEPRDYFGYFEKTFKEKLPAYRELIASRKDEMQALPAVVDAQVIEGAYKLFDTFDFDTFVAELKSLMPRIKSKVVFAHNDTNRANFMIDRSVEPITVDSIRILDFEFSGYNHRGSDIGSHFQNRRIDVAQFLKGKFESALPYPDEASRVIFIRAYLQESSELDVQIDPTIDTVEHVLLEAEYYGMLQQLLFFAYMVADHERWKDVKVVNFNPVLMLASNIKDFMDRKEETLKLLTQLHL